MTTEEQVLDILKDSFRDAPIDWGEVLIDENKVLDDMIKTMFSLNKKLNKNSKEVVLLAAVIKLNVEVAALKAQKEDLVRELIKLKG